MKKKVLAAVAVVLLSALIAAFFSVKIAAAIIVGSMFVGFFILIAFINIKAWSDIAKKDPELAKQLWQESLMNSDFYQRLY